MTPKMVPGILFRIDHVNSLHLSEWVHEIDWQIIASQIKKRGLAIVLDRHPEKIQFSLDTIREIPKQRGRFRPHYGNFGGGFEYCFRPQADGVALTAKCLAKDAEEQFLAPLDLILPTDIEFQVDHVYNTGLIYVDDSWFVSDENRFGFYGEFLEIFRNWEWYSQNAAGFEFQFFPLSVGCMMRVLHIESNTLLDLTKDVEW